MAYNRKNILQRMLDIQEIYIANSRRHKGNMTDCDIFTRLIAPVYRISRKTFYDYLGTNARAELKKLEDVEKQQPTLFELETV